MDNQDDFVAARKPDWSALDELLAGKKPLHAMDPPSISRAASLYRSVCADLMRARAARYETQLVDYLDALAARAHNKLYGARPLELARIWRFFARDFPRALRRQRWFFAIATALFVLPGAFGLLMTLSTPDFATHVLPRSMLEGAARSYADQLDGRAGGDDAMMAGFYVYNNVGIAFRCFATGILFGVGSMFFLFYNGLIIGTTVGFVIDAGHGHNILTFVSGHAPFELTAICISGGAGLRMGWSLVATGGRSRLASLRSAAPEVGTVILGAGAMLVVAAAVEGFWSPSSASAETKWTVAALLTGLVAVYLSLAGRADGRPPSRRSRP